MDAGTARPTAAGVREVEPPPHAHRWRFTVREDEIDALGHASNVVWVDAHGKPTRVPAELAARHGAEGP